MLPVSQNVLVSPSLCNQTLEKKYLEDLYITINQTPPKEFAHFEKKPALCFWLKQLSKYYTQTDNKALAIKITEYLERADQDEEFRKVFYALVEDVSVPCEDRLVLSVLLLDLAYKLATSELYHMPQLASFLQKGVWTVDILKEIACKKALNVPLCNEAKLYLGYLIMLKDELNIPIDIEGIHSLRSFSCDELTQEDIQEAKESVLSKCSNEEEYLDFLSRNNLWKKALATNYEKEFESIKNLRTEASSKEDLSLEEGTKIDQQFHEDVKTLTQKVLLKKEYDFYFS